VLLLTLLVACGGTDGGDEHSRDGSIDSALDAPADAAIDAPADAAIDAPADAAIDAPADAAIDAPADAAIDAPVDAAIDAPVDAAIDGPSSIDAASTATLSVVLAGTGTGTVTSMPSGIDCGADCDEAFPYGTVVTLTAVANAGSMFIGWTGGGCSGTGDCVTTITAADTVTATFTRLPVWDGTWNGTTTQGGRPIAITVVNNRITQIQVGWQVAGCGASGTTTTTFGGGGFAINPMTGAFSRSVPGTPLSYTISGTFALDESGASGTINFTFSQPFPPVCNSTASAQWSATRP
jgi:hypothetical protein